MDAKANPHKSRIGWLWNIVRHGLFLHGLTNRLAKIGLTIVPYYWVQEGLFADEPPKIKGNSSDFKLKQLNLIEVEKAGAMIAPHNMGEMITGFKNGQIYIGLLHHGDMAACMAIELNEFKLNNKQYVLKKNEAYLLNMWTFNAYRGKNIAPFLRYQSYLMLEEMGRDKIYSLSAYFNRSTLKFKNKLKAKNLKLFMTVNLFNKYHGLFVLRNYISSKENKEEQRIFL